MDNTNSLILKTYVFVFYLTKLKDSLFKPNNRQGTVYHIAY